MSTFATPILHADVDAFFASVEQRDDPALRGRELIVGGGVVMAASYEARACGVRGGMGEARARRLCPGAVWVAPRMDAYVAASREVLALFEGAAPQVEGVSIEEAFLDVAAVASATRTPQAIAARLRRDAHERLGLPVTVGVARSKVLAKMASRAAKPDGLLVLAPERERAFLAPLAVERLWGVGPRTAEKLRARGLATVGAVAELSERELAAVLGRAGARAIHAAVHGRDLRPVRPPGPRQSFGAQRALARGTVTPAKLDELLADVVARVTRRLQADGRAGRTVRLHLRFDDFSRVARARTLAHATASPAVVEAAARTLLDAAAPRIAREGLTCLGVSVDNLDAPGGGEQLALPLALT